MALLLAGCELSAELLPQPPAAQPPDPAGSEEPEPPSNGDPEPTTPTEEPPDDGAGATDVEVTGVDGGVEVAAPEGADIYVDDRFTGESAPATVEIDAGAHTVGVGTDDGRFVEFDVERASGDTTVGEGQVVQTRPWRVAIVPVRTTIHGSGGAANTGIVTDEDVELFTEQLQATSDEMVEPFSYGTASWDITVLPMVEDVPLHRGTATGVPPDGGRLVQEAGLRDDLDDYDFHVVFYGVLTADGEQVDDEPCCLWGGGDSVALNNGWDVRTRGPEPFEGFLHEWLHVVEGRHGSDAPEQVTSGGLHGAQELVGEDGSPTSQWLTAYRRFMRSQIDEDGTFTGVFSTLRAGP